MNTFAKFVFGCAFCALLLPVVPAAAAVVKPISGDVFVNTGQGFKVVKTAKKFPAGTQVTLPVGAKAAIDYGANCVVPLTPGAVLSIAPNPPCSQSANLPEDDSQVAGLRDELAPPPQDPTIYIIGGLAAAGGIAAVILSNNDSRPASP
ncbi:MAG: hypothetical protein ACR2O4_02890 [Hyphomicrobiaceae bacterium]